MRRVIPRLFRLSSARACRDEPRCLASAAAENFPLHCLSPLSIWPLVFRYIFHRQSNEVNYRVFIVAGTLPGKLNKWHICFWMKKTFVYATFHIFKVIRRKNDSNFDVKNLRGRNLFIWLIVSCGLKQQHLKNFPECLEVWCHDIKLQFSREQSLVACLPVSPVLSNSSQVCVMRLGFSIARVITCIKARITLSSTVSSLQQHQSTENVPSMPRFQQ